MINLIDFSDRITQDYLRALKQKSLDHRLVRNPDFLEQIKREISEDNILPVTINGSGQYHHLTYGICNQIQFPFGYLHIDAHEDAQSRQEIWGGGFVEQIVNETRATAAICWGIPIAYKFSWSYFHSKERERGYTNLEAYEVDFLKVIDFLPDRVYVSVDLDVLKDFCSDYTCGIMSKEQLFLSLNLIAKRKKIIGGDICGYTGNHQECLETVIETIWKIEQAVLKTSR